MNIINDFFIGLGLVTVVKLLFVDVAFLLFMFGRLGMQFKKNYKDDIFVFTALDLILTFLSIGLFIVLIYAYYCNMDFISFNNSGNTGIFDYYTY